MLSKDDVQAIVLGALNEINDELDDDEKIDVSPQTRLFGSDAVLDSLSLVSVIVAVEAAVADASGRDVVLTDDRAMSEEVSPFTDVGTLTAYILMLLSEPA